MSEVVLNFLKSAASDWHNKFYGPGYRCSVDLTDGTHLPCVIIRDKAPLVDLAIRRFEEEKSDQGVFRNSDDPYRDIVSLFVTTGNRLNSRDIASVGRSRFATPANVLDQIEGETYMGWTGWVFEMDDERLFSFGTEYSAAFFELPDGYEFHNVRKVHNHSYLSDEGELIPIRPFDGIHRDWKVYRERPYFECFVER